MGYLSLHLDSDYLILKWTPNELLNSGEEISCKYQKDAKRRLVLLFKEKNVLKIKNLFS